jgi:hypothetical protein
MTPLGGWMLKTWDGQPTSQRGGHGFSKLLDGPGDIDKIAEQPVGGLLHSRVDGHGADCAHQIRLKQQQIR